jgi:hypothetical protein
MSMQAEERKASASASSRRPVGLGIISMLKLRPLRLSLENVTKGSRGIEVSSMLALNSRGNILSRDVLSFRSIRVEPPVPSRLTSSHDRGCG